MFKKNSNLKVLPVNKTVVFNSPFEGDDVLVRTGTISEGSSFFHSILHAYSKDYISMNKKERVLFVRKLKASITGKNDKESWEEVGGGIISKVPFQEMISNILSNFKIFLDEKEERIRGRATRKTVKTLIKTEKDFELYKVLNSLIPVKEIQDTILQNSYKKSNTLKIKNTITHILKEGTNYFNNLEEIKMIKSDKKEYLLNKFSIFLKTVCLEAEKEAYKNYIDGLEKNKDDIDSYSTEFISDRFERDIYFIDGNTRLPYIQNESTDFLKDRKSIIVIHIGQNHYEVVGRLLPGNKIKREFDSRDPIINKIYMFLKNPSRINSSYPELKDFVSTQMKSPIRNNLKQNIESDAESDLYYDSSHNSDSDSDSEDQE